MITQARLQELLRYEPNTGIFTWRVNRKGGVKAETAAGHTTPTGYCFIGVEGQLYKAHRLAWLYVYGQFPETNLDHINRNPSDNRIANLRLAPQQDNQQNREVNKNNTSGYRGVSYNKLRKKWVAQKQLRGKYHHLGYFNTAKEAHVKYTQFIRSNPNAFYPT
jgi:hypothetical protein